MYSSYAPPAPPIQCWGMADLEWMRAGEINVGFCSRGLCTTGNIEKGGVGGIACLRRAIAFMLLASAQQVALGPTFISPTPGKNSTFASQATLNWQIGDTLACMVVAAELSLMLWVWLCAWLWSDSPYHLLSSMLAGAPRYLALPPMRGRWTPSSGFGQAWPTASR